MMAIMARIPMTPMAIINPLISLILFLLVIQILL
jgi:hypothetical protein